MNKLIIAAILSLGTTAAFAEADISRNDQVVSGKSRAEVVAELRAAVAAGLMRSTVEGETALASADSATLPQRSRAEVQAEARRFRDPNATTLMPATHKGS